MTRQDTDKSHWSPREAFHQVAQASARIVGSAWSFIVAVALIVGWLISGPVFGVSDTWQLIINTGTTIVTFLMVFLIQNTQNRDAKAIHLKLDELLRALKRARTEMVDIEELSGEELDRLEEEFRALHATCAKAKVGNGESRGENLTSPR